MSQPDPNVRLIAEKRFKSKKPRVRVALFVTALLSTFVVPGASTLGAVEAPTNTFVPATVVGGVPTPDTPLSSDDCALVIQMTGTMTDGLGVYEILDPATTPPARTYSDTEATQFVVLPGGCDQVIDVGTTYTPPAWDPSTGTGGVVFLGGSTLNLNASIDASGAGFASGHSVGAGCDGGDGAAVTDLSFWDGGAGGGGIFGGGGGAAGHVGDLATWGNPSEFDASPGGGGTASAAGAGGANGDAWGVAPSGGAADCVGNGGSPDQTAIAGQFYAPGAGAGGGGSYGGGGAACSTRSSGAYSGGGGGGGSYTGGGSGGWEGTNTGYPSSGVNEPGFPGNVAESATITDASHYLNDADARLIMGGAGGGSFLGDGSGPFDGGRGGGVVLLSFDSVVGSGGAVLSNGGDGSTPPNFSGEGSHGSSGSGGGAGGQIAVYSPLVADASFSAVGGIGGLAVEDTSSNSQPHTGSGGASGGGGGIWFAGVGADESNTGANNGESSGTSTLAATGLSNVDWVVAGGNPTLAGFPANVNIGSQSYDSDAWAAIVGAANLDSQITFKNIAVSLVDASAGGFDMAELVAAYPYFGQPNNPKNLGLGCGPGLGGNGLALTSAEIPTSTFATPPVRIGNFVWIDTDEDGEQDAGEIPVADVVANLLDADGDPVLDASGAAVTTTTDADGEYYFDVAAGEYIVGFDLDTLPEGFVVTSQDSGSDDAADSDADPVTGQTSVIDVSDELALTDSDLDGLLDDYSWDMGIIPPVEIGNVVWVDANTNGVQEADEAPVPGVVVNLLDADGDPVLDASGVAVTTMTDADGEYGFTVLPGEFMVEFDLDTLPAKSLVTSQDSGSDDAVDSDADPATGVTDVIDVSDRSVLTDTDGNGIVDDLTWDLGIVPPVKIGNVVWIDADADGVQDAGEEPVPGVVVNLLDAAGNAAFDASGAAITATTDADGEYYFDVEASVHGVQFDLATLPAGYVPTSQDAGSDDAVDSDADPSTGLINLIDVADLSVLADTDSDGVIDDYAWDLGIVPPVKIGNFVWLDANADGIQDADETPIAGVDAYLLDFIGSVVLDSSGTPINATTDAAGEYYFDVPAGDYTIEFDLGTLPAGHTVTLQNSGSDDAVDSDVDPFSGQTDFFSVDQFSGITDTDGDGVLDDYTHDLGVSPPVQIGNFVWIDANADGVQDADEAPVADVAADLLFATGGPVLDAAGTPITTVTDAAGEYYFDVAPGEYIVKFDLDTLPAGYAVTRRDAGFSDATDSDVDPIRGETSVIDVTDLSAFADTNGDGIVDDFSFDMGIISPVQIGNFVWIDADADGVQDAGEEPVAGVVVNLLDADGDPVLDASGVAVTATTDAAGEYTFDVESSEYIVEFDLDTLPDGYVVTSQDSGPDSLDSDVDPATGQTDVITVDSFSGITDTNGDGILDDFTYDMGIVPPVQIGNFVWIDADADGVQDASETPVAGVVVNLLDADGNPVLDASGAAVTATTDADGEYGFEVEAGDYIVEFDLDTLPAGHVVTSQDSGADASDSDVDQDSGQTDVFTVDPFSGIRDTDGDGVLDDYTYDLGIVPPVQIGNFVWIDADADGVQDADEAPVAGVVVNLLDADGDPVLDASGVAVTATTDADGEYFFDVEAAVHGVEFDLDTLPAGYIVTNQDAGTDDAVDSDADPITGQTSIIDVTDVSTLADTNGDGILDDFTWDMGIVPPVQIGDLVWIDANADGIQDADEAPVADVVVSLLDADGNAVLDASGAVVTAVTDEAGEYGFEVEAGEYIVEFDLDTLPDGYVVTVAGEGDDETGSDADQVTGQTDVFTVDPFSGITDTDGDGILDDFTYDMGIVPPVQIGNFVWIDADADGIQDAGEAPVAGVVVSLLDADGNVVLDASGAPVTATTDAEGEYAFDVEAAVHGVEFDLDTLPAGYVVTVQDAGTDDAVDSDADPVTGQTSIIDVTDVSILVDTDGDGILDDFTWDMGIVPPVQIGDLVWIDADADGVQDADEAPVAGVVVNLLDAAGDPVLDASGDEVTATTDEAGEYGFEVEAGDYIVEFDLNTLPDGHVVTVAGEGDDETGSDADQATGQTDVFTVDPSTLADTDGDGILDDFTYDMGIVPPVQIGDLVWNDANADGIQDADEAPVAGVVVNLLDADGNAVLDAFGAPVTATTDAAGEYGFEVAAGDYIVEFDLDTLPDGALVTLQDSGADAADSDADEVTGQTDVFTVDPSTLADTDGDDILDDYSYDMGIYAIPAVPPVQIGDLVWNDANADGIQDADEAPVAGVVVNLLDAAGDPVLDASGDEVTATTDEAGEYGFEVEAGEYIVEFDLDTLPEDYLVTLAGLGNEETGSDADQVTGQTKVFTVDPSTLADTDGDGILDDYSYDMGIYEIPVAPPVPPVQIGDLVWDDANADGVQDAGEAPIADVVVNLLDTAGDPVLDAIGEPITATTDDAGEYSFDVAPGEYIVEFVPPAGTMLTVSNAGGDTAADSNADPISGLSNVIDVSDPSTLADTDGDGIVDDYSIDAGLVSVAMIGSSVWIDADDDGVQGDDEALVADVIVNLLDANGDPVLDSSGEPMSTTTNVNGDYSFVVPAGDYIVEFSLASIPVGAQFAIANAGDDDAADSDADPITGQTGIISVDPTALTDTNGDGIPDDLTHDAGVTNLVRIGDVVWFDANGDGMQDSDEAGAAGVLVELLDADGEPVLSQDGVPIVTTTDSDGNYSFSVVPGDYQLQFALPDGFAGTVPNAGDSDTVDSDTDRFGLIPTFTVAPGTNDDILHMGLVETQAITGVLWDDVDQDGIKDAGEPVMEGVTVELFDGANPPKAVLDVDGDQVMDRSDFGGSYSIDVVPGEYRLQFTAEDGTVIPALNDDGEQIREDGLTDIVAYVLGVSMENVDLGVMATANVVDPATPNVVDPATPNVAVPPAPAPALAFTGRTMLGTVVLGLILLIGGLFVVETTRSRKRKELN